jgi:hypothetical protein
VAGPEVERKEPVWFVGRAGDWFVPVMPGTVTDTTLDDRIVIEDLEVGQGGQVLVADRDKKAICLISDGGIATCITRGFDVRKGRLAVNRFSGAVDEFAVLDRDEKNVLVVGLGNGQRVVIPRRGAGYELAEPVDLAYGPLGHVYVLDRGARAVLIYRTDGHFVNRQALTTAGKPTAVDGAGSRFVDDDGSKAITVYEEHAVKG